MIITRSPLRITLGGGGTDLPSYYETHGGFVVSAAIDKYVYVTITRPFVPGIFLKYSRLEHVESVEEVQHPIIRAALRRLNLRTPQVEITTLADIPAGTGLGSSGSFTTALLKGLYAHRKEMLHPSQVADLACQIEINDLNEPVGRQDQYIAAYGGLTCFSFLPDGTVEAVPLKIGISTLHDLEDHLLLFFTGFVRSASAMLEDQKQKTTQNNQEMLNNLHGVKELGYLSQKALESGKLGEFGEIMHLQWEQKKSRSAGMTNQRINDLYDLGKRNGARGGKLVGAGGGGFLLFYADDRNKLRSAMKDAGLEEVRFRFDFEGCKTLLV